MDLYRDDYFKKKLFELFVEIIIDFGYAYLLYYKLQNKFESNFFFNML